MALSVVLVKKYDPVLPEIDIPVHNGFDASTVNTTTLKNKTPKVGVHTISFYRHLNEH